MTKKEKFIEVVENMFSDTDLVNYCNGDAEFANDVITYFEALKGGSDKEKPAFTETGKEILAFMQTNKDLYNNLFTAKSVAEGMNKASRSISGSMKKLITDGYVEKLGENPCSYSLTDKGRDVDLTN